MKLRIEYFTYTGKYAELGFYNDPNEENLIFSHSITNDGKIHYGTIRNWKNL